MKINYKCLPCLVNQVVKVAEMTNVTQREKLFQDVFKYLSKLDFNKTNPEVIGTTFRMLKQHIGNEDPYLEIRNYYNELFLKMEEEFEKKIDESINPFEEAVKYAIVGNIIDFNPVHNHSMADIMAYFNQIDEYKLSINDSDELIRDVQDAKVILYLGDNCGEICLDKILVKKIKALNPNSHIYFGTRGAAVVNDSIAEDAYSVGINQYATVISNGDDSLGTVLSRTSEAFNEIYEKADVVIAKGQANYESLSEEKKNIYFMLMTKCEVISEYIGTAQKSLVCMKRLNRELKRLCRR